MELRSPWIILGRLGLGCYLVFYLAAAGPLTAMVWRHGGHATPEQWAYHLMLIRLGIPHHHDADDDDEIEPEPEHHATHLSIAWLLPGTLPIMIPPPVPPPLLSDSTLPIWSGAAFGLFACTSPWMRVVERQILPSGRSVEPLERPPMITATV